MHATLGKHWPSRVWEVLANRGGQKRKPPRRARVMPRLEELEGRLTPASAILSPTTTTLAASLAAPTYGQSVTFTATVHSPGGSPTGSVQFQIDGQNYGSPQTLSVGVANVVDANLAVGAHAVTAVYSGGSGFLNSTGVLGTGTYVLGGPANALTSSSGGWAWDTNGQQPAYLDGAAGTNDYKGAIQNPAYFGASGIVQTTVSTRNLSTINASTLASLNGFIAPYWTNAQSLVVDPQSGVSYAQDVVNFFEAGGDLILLQDDASHDAIGQLLGIPTTGASTGSVSNGSSPLFVGPFGAASNVTQTGTVGQLSATGVAASGGTVGAANTAGQVTAAYWNAGQYTDQSGHVIATAGRLLILADVDMWSTFGTANYSTLNANAQFALDGTAFVVAHYVVGAAPVTVTTSGDSANFVVNLPVGVTDAVLAAGPAGMETISSASNAFAALTFADPSGSLTIHAGGSNSRVQIGRQDAAFLPAAITLTGQAGDTFQLTTDNALPTASTLTLTTATLDLNGHNDAIGGLDGNGTVTNGAAGTATLTVGSDNGSDAFSGVLQDGSGAVALTKTGSGSETLSDDNTYSGATTVSAGNLVVNGSLTSAVTVNSGGTLSGTGSTGAVTVNSGGALNPGPVGSPLLQSGLVSRWAADGNANDGVGSNDGTLETGATFAAGQFGQAFCFNGASYVQATSDGLPTGNADRTLGLWINVRSFAAAETFLAGYGAFGASTQAYEILASGQTLAFSQWGSEISGGPALQAGQWYYVAVTNVGDSVTLYLNGVAVASGDLSLSTASGAPFYVGRIAGALGDTRQLDGLADEVQVYNRALSAAEIQGVYTAGLGVLNTGSVALNAGANFDASIGGNSAAHYTQDNVTGTVSLGGATLHLSSFGEYVPQASDVYLLINNDGTDAVSGTFAGLAEGALVSGDFLGSGLSATITYVGGDGNDVAIDVDGPPAQLALAGPATLTAGAVPTPFTVQLEDSSGRAITSTIDDGDVIDLGTNSASGHFFSDAAGNDPISTLHLTDGSAVFYYSDTAAAVPTLTATDATHTLTAGTQTESSFTPPTATEGVAFGFTTVFTFTDADPNAADYTATVQTGDGHTYTSAADPSIVRVTADSTVSGQFHVQLHYTYTEELSNQTFSVSVSDLGGATFGDGTTASGNLVTNGGFETGDFSGWTQSGNLGATFIESSATARSGSYSAALGPVGSLGFLTQNIATVPNQQYTFSWWLQNDGGTPNAFQASWNGTVIQASILNNTAAQPYTLYSFTEKATGASTPIQFGFRQDPAYFHLDDVTVTASGVAAGGFSVADAPLTDTTPANSTAQATAGNAFSGLVLATFDDANPGATAADFPAANISVNYTNSPDFTSDPTYAVQADGAPSGGLSHWEVVASGTVAAAGDYVATVAVSDVGGSTLSTSNTTLNVDAPPAVTTPPTSLTVNAGASASFTAAASGTPTPTVQWKAEAPGATTFTPLGDGGVYSNTGTATLSISNVTGLDGYKYEAVFSNTVDSVPSDPATLTVASQLAITSTPQTLTAGAVSGPVTLHLEDSFGNPIGTDGDAGDVIALSDGSAGGAFYSDSAGLHPITSESPLFLGDDGSATFYYSNTTAGGPTLTAADSTHTALTAGTQTETVNAGTASEIAFATPDATSVTAGQKSGAITLEATDQYGNPVAGETIDLGSSHASTGLFFSPAVVTQGPGGGIQGFATLNQPIQSVVTGADGKASFLYEDATAGSPILKATDDSNPAVFAQQTETVNSGPASTITFSSPSPALTAGADSTITLTVRDAEGNPVPGEQIDLTTPDIHTGQFNDSASSVSVITGSDGKVSFVYHDTQAGPVTLTATDHALTGVTAQQLDTVFAAAPAQLIFLQQPSTATAAQPFGSDVKVEVVDAYGNPVSGDGVTVAVASGPSSETFDSASTLTAISGADGVADFKNLILDAAGSYTFTASDATLAGVPSADVVVFPAFVTLTPGNLPAGSDIPTVTAQTGSLALGGTFSNQGTQSLNVLIRWGDGQSDTVAATAAGIFSDAHVYQTEGAYAVSVQVLDSHGNQVGVGALAEAVEVLPPAPHAGTVNVVQGTPGQTVSQTVSNAVTGTITTTSLTLGVGDAVGGAVIATDLNQFVPSATPNGVQVISSFDVREVNLSNDNDASALVSFLIPFDPKTFQGKEPVLLYFDAKLNQEVRFVGFSQVIPEGNLLFVSLRLDKNSVPSLQDATGTVFTVAASTSSTPTVTAVSAATASTAPGANVAVQTASFQSTSQLTLPLAASQASQLSTTRSALSTNDAGGGDDQPLTDAQADALVKFLFEKLDLVPKNLMQLRLEQIIRLWLGSVSLSAPDGSAGHAAGELPGAAAERLAAQDFLFRDLQPMFGRFDPTAAGVAGQVVARSWVEGADQAPDAPTNETPAYAWAIPVVGLGLGASAARRKRRRQQTGRRI